MNGVLKGFDTYSRTARLYPSLIAIVPFVGLLFLPTTSVVEALTRAGLLVLCAGAIAYAFASYVRFRGKSLEGDIIARMGGWPSTSMLRHRDSTIDADKASLPHALEELSGVALPSEAEERADPVAADAVYRSATKVLLEARRGPEQHVLLGENVSYGFWRNLYGVKSIALILATSIAIASAIFLTLDLRSTGGWTTESVHFLYAIVFEALYIVLLSLTASESMVHRAARSYAEALLRTLDHPR